MVTESIFIALLAYCTSVVYYNHREVTVPILLTLLEPGTYTKGSARLLYSAGVD